MVAPRNDRGEHRNLVAPRNDECNTGSQETPFWARLQNRPIFLFDTYSSITSQIYCYYKKMGKKTGKNEEMQENFKNLSPNTILFEKIVV